MSHAIESIQNKYEGLNQIGALEHELIVLAEIKADRQLIIFKMLEMMTLTRNLLKEEKSYFDDLQS